MVHEEHDTSLENLSTQKSQAKGTNNILDLSIDNGNTNPYDDMKKLQDSQSDLMSQSNKLRKSNTLRRSTIVQAQSEKGRTTGFDQDFMHYKTGLNVQH